MYTSWYKQTSRSLFRCVTLCKSPVYQFCSVALDIAPCYPYTQYSI